MSVEAAPAPAESLTFPPEPWQLGGSMLLTVFALPTRSLPAEVDEFAPDGVRPVLLGGHALLGAALVRYAPGSVVEYDELLVSALTRRGRKLVSTLPHIWVNSPESVAGGRALWAIPKGLAEFARDGDSATVDVEGRRAASLTARVGGRLLPGWQSFTLTTAQRLEGRSVLATNAARAHARRARIDWDFPADGPLGYMRAGRPLFSVELDEMGISFGLSCLRW
ncbi:MAG TPA: acetoacetate decarboxylase family protein [Thermoleophilaceae bacterium]|nr:acetoacetate decarboxylase family protein [Thermoleophilaceae bacterium]